MAESLLDNYNPLYDVHLRQYFALPHMQKHLRRMGLLEQSQQGAGDEVYERHHAMMDMMLKNREQQLMKMAELKGKLDAAEKVETCRRIRSGLSPESYRRAKPSRSLSRGRPSSGQQRQRRFSNSFEDKEVIKKMEQEYKDVEPHLDTRDAYKRLSANVKRFNYLHKMDDPTLISYKDNLKRQLQRLERFREISFGVHSVARQPPLAQTSWFFRRRSLPSLTSSAPNNALLEPLRSINNLRGRKHSPGGNGKLNASHDSRTSCPPTMRKRRESNPRLPPISSKGKPKTSKATTSAPAARLPPARPPQTRGRPITKKETMTTVKSNEDSNGLPSITGIALLGGAGVAATAAAAAVVLSDEPKIVPPPKPEVTLPPVQQERYVSPEPEPERDPTPEQPREPSPEPVREPTPTEAPVSPVVQAASPEPPKQKSPEPVRELSPKPVQVASPEPIREPTPEQPVSPELPREEYREPSPELVQHEKIEQTQESNPEPEREHTPETYEAAPDKAEEANEIPSLEQPSSPARSEHEEEVMHQRHGRSVEQQPDDSEDSEPEYAEEDKEEMRMEEEQRQGEEKEQEAEEEVAHGDVYPPSPVVHSPPVSPGIQDNQPVEPENADEQVEQASQEQDIEEPFERQEHQLLTDVDAVVPDTAEESLPTVVVDHEDQEVPMETEAELTEASSDIYDQQLTHEEPMGDDSAYETHEESTHAQVNPDEEVAPDHHEHQEEQQQLQDDMEAVVEHYQEPIPEEMQHAAEENLEATVEEPEKLMAPTEIEEEMPEEKAEEVAAEHHIQQHIEESAAVEPIEPHHPGEEEDHSQLEESQHDEEVRHVQEHDEEQPETEYHTMAVHSEESHSNEYEQFKNESDSEQAVREATPEKMELEEVHPASEHEDLGVAFHQFEEAPTTEEQHIFEEHKTEEPVVIADEEASEPVPPIQDYVSSNVVAHAPYSDEHDHVEDSSGVTLEITPAPYQANSEDEDSQPQYAREAEKAMEEGHEKEEEHQGEGEEEKEEDAMSTDSMIIHDEKDSNQPAGGAVDPMMQSVYEERSSPSELAHHYEETDEAEVLPPADDQNEQSDVSDEHDDEEIEADDESSRHPPVVVRDAEWQDGNQHVHERTTDNHYENEDGHHIYSHTETTTTTTTSTEAAAPLQDDSNNNDDGKSVKSLEDEMTSSVYNGNLDGTTGQSSSAHAQEEEHNVSSL